MRRSKEPEVLVVGAGPVGQLAALELAERGIAVEIVEEEWRSAGHSYALALHSEAQRLLAELGLQEDVGANALQVPRLALYEGVDRRAEVELGAAGDPPYLAVISQHALERILEDALEERGVNVRWNHRLSRFLQEDDQVRAVVDKLTKESVGYAVSGTEWLVSKSKERPVAFVVGADGHHSLVRRQIGIPFEEVAPAQHFSVFELTTDADVGNEMRIAFGPAGTTIYWPLPERRCRFSFESAEPVSPATSRRKDRLVFQFRGRGYPALELEQLHELLAERAPWFDGTVENVHWSTVVRFERRIAGRFGQGRIWLVGDAGHMAGPAGIQSMNVGLREAHELAITLHRILGGDGSMDELEAYGHERLAEWRRLQGISGRLVPTNDTDPWVRDHCESLLSCLPASGEGLIALAQSLGLRYEPIPVAPHV
ncbi:MAG TPA: FAD-dependent monooxygenase [Thermoanaerobaculia bacterium]|nr:FAD-dependent monooxygenase [Thermoanaerobaculia bacterium]